MKGDFGVPPGPVTGSERLASLDFTRGVAVMGILFANIIGMGEPYLAYFWPGGFVGSHDRLADALWVVQFVFVDGKMRGLFTLLFGAGLVLFVEHARARGKGRALALLRLFWLLLFGLAHFYFLWRGDILTLYALCGMIALFAIDWAPIQQFAAGLTGYLAGMAYNTVGLAPLWLASDPTRGKLPEYARIADATRAMLESERADAAREIAIQTGGTYGDYVAHALDMHRWNWIDLFMYNVAEALPLMLMGMALYRVGLFDGRLDPRAQARWGGLGVIAGAVLTLPLALWAYFDGLTYEGTLFFSLGPQGFARLPMVLGLAALLALWGPRATGWLGSRVTAAGRAAFTNYIGSSLVMLFVFGGWGLGMFGTLDREQLYLVAVGGCLVMLAWSRPWLAHFRFGPLEWLWRSLTYRRLFALKR